MQEGYDPYASEYNFKYFTRLQFDCIAITANCKQTTQFPHFAILIIA